MKEEFEGKNNGDRIRREVPKESWLTFSESQTVFYSFTYRHFYLLVLVQMLIEAIIISTTNLLDKGYKERRE